MKEFRLLYLIGDIQDKFILEAAQEQQDTRRGGFSKKIRYCALGLCAAMALCAGLVVYTQFQRTSDSLVGRPKVTTAVTDDDVQIANPGMHRPFRGGTDRRVLHYSTGFLRQQFW